MLLDDIGPWRLAARLVVAVCLSLVAVGSAIAECTVPQFHTTRDYMNPQTGKGSMSVILSPDDVTLDKLLCMAQHLKEPHPQWRDVAVLMFSSDDAAMNFNPSPMSGPVEHRFQRGLRALYLFNLDDHKESLAITPLGIEGGDAYDTTIDLPVAGRVHCRLEVSGRCLLALEPVTYPGDALRSRESGKVTLTATIGPDGKIVVANTGPQQGSDRLVGAAVDNLKTWWLDAIAREDTFRITYTYVVDSSLQRGQVDVQLALPTQITIRANPPE